LEQLASAGQKENPKIAVEVDAWQDTINTVAAAHCFCSCVVSFAIQILRAQIIFRYPDSLNRPD
jgi:hypothetical protein